MKSYEVPAVVRAAVPGCPIVYVSDREIPAHQLIGFYKRVIMPVHRKVVGLLEEEIRKTQS